MPTCKKVAESANGRKCGSWQHITINCHSHFWSECQEVHSSFVIAQCSHDIILNVLQSSKKVWTFLFLIMLHALLLLCSCSIVQCSGVYTCINFQRVAFICIWWQHFVLLHVLCISNGKKLPPVQELKLILIIEK